MNEKLVERLPVRKHHLRRLNPNNNTMSTTRRTRQTLVPRNLQTTVRTPDILVPPGYEDRLPDSQVLPRTTRLPLRNIQSNRSECPSCFLSPSREIFGFLFAAFVKVAPLPFLAESSRHRLFAMNYSGTGAAVDHFSESIMKRPLPDIRAVLL